MIRVLIADDHPMMRSGLTQLLEATDDLEVVGQCADDVIGEERVGVGDVGHGNRIPVREAP